ncbi:MAG: hypothetical protein QOC99_1462 [Acidobacteriota bacterium]|jgi:hypothetical protein|nr:hypothetical protein [Acidobacteriota bacterium]
MRVVYNISRYTVAFLVITYGFGGTFMKSAHRYVVLLLVFLCLTSALPLRAGASVGDRLEDMKQTDFFKFFGLVEEEPRAQAGGLTVVNFRPRAGKFHQLVKVTVSIDGAGVIRAMELALERSFVDDGAQGIFARDIAKSFLRSAIPVEDERGIRDLANEIEFPKELKGYAIARTRPDPKLPLQPTKGYLVYLGKQPLQEQLFSKSRVRLENIHKETGDVLHISVVSSKARAAA